MPIVTDPASPDFNSYVSVAEFNSYVDLRGIVVDMDVEPLLIEAMDYLDTLSWAGVPTVSGQPQKFPRSGLYLDNQEVGNNVIPQAVKKAQLRLALAAMDTPLSPSFEGGPVVKSESIAGAISVTYDTGDNMGVKTPTFPWLDGLIGDFVGPSMLGNISVWRG